MLWIAISFVKSTLAALIDSRLGQCAVVAAAAWYWSAQNTDAKWEAIIANEKAQIEQAYQKELARQKDAAVEIALEADKRNAENALVVSEMQATIDAYMKKLKEQPHVVTKDRVVTDCSVDNDFAAVVQQLDSPRVRKANSPARSGKLR